LTPSIYSLFVLGATLTCIITPVVRYIALRKGVVDCPQRARKVHQQTTPRLIGAAVLLYFFVVVSVVELAVIQLSKMLWGNKLVIGSILYRNV
jgi:UDP-N-acetylmuramyl pentapeptide phosphotransferase/UDP-N-acetylglucosamine-1-phosphate transferase